MKTDIAALLKAEYGPMWHDTMCDLPDGWTQPLVDMLERLYRLSSIDAFRDRVVYWVSVRVDVYGSSAMAFACPIMPSHTWTPGRAMACVEALTEFTGRTQETCRVCGKDGYLRTAILGDHGEGVFCDQHAGGDHAG